MICPNCSMPCGDQDRFCVRCGCPLAGQEKRGTHWIPLLILLIMTLIGTTVYFLDHSAATVSPFPWFHNENGSLSYQAELYDGPAKITVPERIDGRDVTALSPRCFAYYDGISTVVLPDTITVIGSQAFEFCSDLHGIYLPEGVISLDSRVFAGCYNLEAIWIPASVKSIGSDVFTGCDSLKHVFFAGNQQQWNRLQVEFSAGQPEIYFMDGNN